MKVEVKYKEENKTGNIFIMGNIVVSDDEDKLVVMVHGDTSGYAFKGTCITSNAAYRIGELAVGLDKKLFKQFQGTITISN